MRKSGKIGMLLAAALLLAGIAGSSPDLYRAGIPDGPRPLADEPHGASPRLPARAWAPVKAADPQIAQLIDSIDSADMMSRLEWVVGLGQRWSEGNLIQGVADSLEAKLASFGLATEQHPFTYNSRPLNNVVATQVGTAHPDSFFVICAHYDATSESPRSSTPGADDNGTGIVTVLKAAQLLAAHQTDYSIKYVLFAAEEQGLWGSRYWVQDEAAANVNLVGALNVDMIGWWESGVPFDLEIETNAHSRWIADAIVNASDLYTTMPVQLHQGENYYWGDFYRFWQNGYACVNHEESFDWYDPDFNPYYHSTNDIPANVSPEMFTGSAQVIISGLMSLVGLQTSPAPVGDLAPAVARSGAYPNPFNAHTTIWLEAEGPDRGITVEFFDLRGRRVGALPMTLRDGRAGAAWNGLTGGGGALPSGTYLYRADVGGRQATGRVVLLK